MGTDEHLSPNKIVTGAILTDFTRREIVYRKLEEALDERPLLALPV